MLYALRDGVLLGLLISVLIGPVFFLLIEISIKEGFRSALFMDAGIILSDAVCIFVAYFGMAALLENPRNKFIFILVGSGILLIMGILKLIPPKKKDPEDIKMREFQVKRSNPFWLALQGFFYNLLNPSTIIFWITTVGGAVAVYDGDRELIGIQFTSTLAVVFFIDVTKAWFAKKMRSFLNPAKMRKANIVIGIFFIGFSIVLVVRALMGKM